MNATQRELFLQAPALAHPPGVEPNFTNPETLRDVARPASIACIIIATLVVAMRTFTKLKTSQGLHLEDYFIICSWVVFVAAYEAPTMILQDRKYGAHQWNMTMGELRDQLKFVWIISIFYCVGILFLKAGINLQGLRVFCPQGVRDLTYYAWQGLFWGNNIFYLALALLEIFTCRPINKVWDLTITEGHCINSRLFHVLAAIINTVSDSLMLLLLQKAIWGLNMNFRTKLGLSSIFLCGLGACAFAAVRIPYTIALYETTDVTYQVVRMGLWTEAEYVFGIFAACMSVISKFSSILGAYPVIISLNNTFQRILSSQNSGTNSSDHETTSKDTPKAQSKKGPIITDIEFHSLVRDPEMGSVSVPEFDQRNRSASSDYKSLDFITKPSTHSSN